MAPPKSEHGEREREVLPQNTRRALCCEARGALRCEPSFEMDEQNIENPLHIHARPRVPTQLRAPLQS